MSGDRNFIFMLPYQDPFLWMASSGHGHSYMTILKFGGPNHMSGIAEARVVKFFYTDRL